MQEKHDFIVTGGAGLIGANIVSVLNRRGITDILIADHVNHPGKQENLDRLQFAKYMEKDEFRRAVSAGQIAPPKTIFHLGACSSTTETDAAYLDDNNTQCTIDLCKWALANGTRFIYASSAATYGGGEFGYSDADDVTPKLKPLNLYGWSKQKFDLWAKSNGLLGKITGIKYFNVFGPGEDHKCSMRSVINKAFTQIQQTGRMSLFKSCHPDYADGCQDRDFVYVRDAARVTVFFHDHPEANGFFNCGTGNAQTWLALANALFAAMDLKPQIDFIDMPETLRDKYQYHTQAEAGKLRAAGCEPPSTPLADSVREYVRKWLAVPPASRSFSTLI